MNQPATPTKGRIIALDLMRGYFLWVILIDHLNRFPGIFEIFTGKALLWATAADGFFLESGVLVGYLRGKEVRSGKFGVAWRWLWRRALVLYAWTVALTLFSTLIAFWFKGNPGIHPGFVFMPIGETIWKALTLQYSYTWADFLRFYCVYMFVAPLALWLMSKRQAWLVLLTAGVVWYFGRHNQFFVWQLLFFIGLTGGYHFTEWENWWHRLSVAGQRWLRWSVVGLAAAVLVTNLWVKHLYGFEGGWITTWFDHWTLAPGHLATALIWFAGLYLLVRESEPFFKKVLGWLFLPVGQNSLATYIFQSFVLIAVGLLIPYPTGTLGINFLINLSAISVVWVFAYWYNRWQKLRKRKPVGLAG